MSGKILMGKLRTVKGDVRNPQFSEKNELAIIPHCCNNLKIMGAGVALALKNKWNKVWTQYIKKGVFNLGENSYAKVEKNIIVVNMIGQDGIVSATNSIPVKYWAIGKCLRSIRCELISSLNSNEETKGMIPVIHAPKFGSDLAKGDFNFILELIREELLEHGIDVVIYEFE